MDGTRLRRRFLFFVVDCGNCVRVCFLRAFVSCRVGFGALARGAPRGLPFRHGKGVFSLGPLYGAIGGKHHHAPIGSNGASLGSRQGASIGQRGHGGLYLYYIGGTIRIFVGARLYGGLSIGTISGGSSVYFSR